MLHVPVSSFSTIYRPAFKGQLDYYMSYLGEILLAIQEDKLPIAGIFAWGKAYCSISRFISPLTKRS